MTGSETEVDSLEGIVADRDFRPTVAVFRPDDDRLRRAVDLLEELGADPVPDPMLAVEPTGAVPGQGADYVVFTSKTGAELVAAAGWTPGESVVCAIGDATAEALRAAGYRVDLIPETFTSAGLVAALETEVGGSTVEVARSDHGSDVLLTGLREAGADLTETVLYRLVRPEGAGTSTDLAATGKLDAALFTSSLTVEHFLSAAADRGVREGAVDGLSAGVVGAIGPPTAETAREHGLAVDVVPETAEFESLARAAMTELRDREDGDGDDAGSDRPDHA